MLGRFEGREFELELRADVARYRGDDFDVRFDPTDPAGTIAGDATGEIDLTYFHMMRLLAEGLRGDVNAVTC